jgi:hypothetical protein
MTRGVLIVTLCVSSVAPAISAPPTAEVAKMCRQLAIKAHPTQPPGSRTGYQQAQRAYFQDCVEKNSKEQKQN